MKLRLIKNLVLLVLCRAGVLQATARENFEQYANSSEKNAATFVALQVALGKFIVGQSPFRGPLNIATPFPAAVYNSILERDKSLLLAITESIDVLELTNSRKDLSNRVVSQAVLSGAILLQSILLNGINRGLKKHMPDAMLSRRIIKVISLVTMSTAWVVASDEINKEFLSNSLGLNKHSYFIVNGLRTLLAEIVAHPLAKCLENAEKAELATELGTLQEALQVPVATELATA